MMQKKARKYLEESGYEGRVADTYSPLLAGFWNIISDDPFLEGKNQEYIDMILGAIEEIGNVEKQDDEENILKRIFDERIRVAPDKDRTIWEMMTEKDDMLNMKYDDEIQRIGIRIFFTERKRRLRH